MYGRILIFGRLIEKNKNLEALANPDSLKLFKNIKELDG